jgi:HSP20 family protein
MSMLQFDPFRELERLIEWPVSWTRPSAMPMDAYRHGENVEVDFDLPGVDASDIEMTVEQNVLTVKTVRHRAPIEGEEVIASERPQGRFTRQLFLGENLDSDRVEASYENGVLHVTIPVAESSKARRIEVGSGKREAIGAGSAAA